MRYLYNVRCFVILIVAASCSITRKVPDGSYLLNKNTVIVASRPTTTTASRDLSTEEIHSYIRQQPNHRDMFRIALGIYNMSGKDTARWINRKLQGWGEAPVIFDSSYLKPSVDNIKTYLRNRGFYHAVVRDTVIYRKKKAEVIYTVVPQTSYIIRKIEYDIADTAIKRLVMLDTTRLRIGRRLSPNMLDRESEAITTRLRNNGYYAFNKTFVKFRADSTLGKMQVDLKVTVTPFNAVDEVNRIIEVNHPVYRINNIYVYTNYNSLLAAKDSTYTKTFDTLYGDKLNLLYRNRINLKQGIISRVNLIEKGEIYCEEKINKTYNNLFDLAQFKSVNIQFRKAGSDSLDCLIFLDPLSSQYYKFDFELSTNSSDMIGFAPGLNYGHRNLLKGAEEFKFNFRGVLQYSYRIAGKTSKEYNVGASLDLPRFLMPVSIGYFKTQLPHTQFNASYSYQQRPDYTRAMANLRFGYRWKSSQTNTFMINFPDFNMIKMYDLSRDFYIRINNPYLKNMYSNHFIMAMTGSFIYNNRNEQRTRWRRDKQLYYRINTDLAGNILSLFNFMMPRDPDLGRKIAGMVYSQYVKGDVNLVYTLPRNTASSSVYRVYFGTGKAYGNSLAIPFEKMYYAGGANSMRGWQGRELGPGSVAADSAVGSFPNQVGDLRLELNAERRFPLFWRLEGALFVDAGNVWSLNYTANRESDANFSFSTFYKEIAMNTGFGLRLNFGYFILRVDAGLKVHDPGRAVGNRLILPNKWFNNNNYSVHIGINYPFND